MEEGDVDGAVDRKGARREVDAETGGELEAPSNFIVLLLLYDLVLAARRAARRDGETGGGRAERVEASVLEDISGSRECCQVPSPSSLQPAWLSGQGSHVSGSDGMCST